MLALPDVQVRMMDALLLRRSGTAGAAALVRSSAALPAAWRLQIYRNNLFESLTAALAAVYPVVVRLVGAQFFRGVAKAYVSAHPSRSGNLHDFGAELPGFLRAYRPAAELIYLPDVAALEWACHRAYHEEELPPIDLARVARMPEAQWADCRFFLQPSARFASSRFPVLAIWQANQPAGFDGESTISLDDGGSDLLVVQRHLEVEIRVLHRGEGAWLRAMDDGARLAEATQRALDADPAFDLGAALARHLGLGLFTGVTT